MKTHQRQWLSDFAELLGSMRFAIYLLVIVCVASAIGTLLEQNREPIFYIDLFGTYWYQVFAKFQVAHIYNNWWFLLIMGFLVLSTTLCLWRHVPKIVKDVRGFKTHLREHSWRAFPHRFSVMSAYTPEQVQQLSQGWLQGKGYRWQTQQYGDTVLLAAKKGGGSRLGYIAAHVAIVVICIGGLLDSELPNRFGIWWASKTPISEQARLVSDVTSPSRFSTQNPSFRGNVMVREGDTVAHAMLTLGEDRYLQQLPFSIRLNRFVVEYYETNGMPKRFASEVTIHDPERGEQEDVTIEVNHPYQRRGITLYQSSFMDGGSQLSFAVLGLRGQVAEQGATLNAIVGDSTPIHWNGQDYRLQIHEFKPINVENLADASPENTPPAQGLTQLTGKLTGSAAARNAALNNVGPLVQYSLTDVRNQSLRFQNYMLPVTLEGQLVFLWGVQLPHEGGFRYVRVPADAQYSAAEFLAMYRGLHNAQWRTKAAQAYAQRLPDERLGAQSVTALAERALSIFAQGGFKGIDDHVNGVGLPDSERVPANLRGPLRQILNDYVLFAAVELRNMARQSLGLPALQFSNPDDPQHRQEALWFEVAIRALSDLAHYPVPAVLQLENFDHVQATVLQATRSPGKWMVYLGALLLMIGVFQMFYIRERRVWLWIRPDGQHTLLKGVMSAHKRNLDFERDVAQLQTDFQELQRTQHV